MKVKGQVERWVTLGIFLMHFDLDEKRGLVMCHLFIGQIFRKRIHHYHCLLPILHLKCQNKLLVQKIRGLWIAVMNCSILIIQHLPIYFDMSIGLFLVHISGQWRFSWKMLYLVSAWFQLDCEIDNYCSQTEKR